VKWGVGGGGKMVRLKPQIRDFRVETKELNVRKERGGEYKGN